MPWSGAISAGDGWVLFKGASAGNTLHAHPALQLTTAQDGAVSILGQHGFVRRSPAIIVRPKVLHQLAPHPSVHVLLVEPQSPLAQYILAHTPPEPICAAPIKLRRALANGPKAVLAGLPPLPLDPKLATAMATLRNGADAIAVTQAAKAAGLSPSRLRALAQAHLGLSLGEWLVWRKLDRACAALSRGAKLADAAARGGFADQAHLTRTMRRVFGVTPGMSKAWRRSAMTA